MITANIVVNHKIKTIKSHQKKHISPLEWQNNEYECLSTRIPLLKQNTKWRLIIQITDSKITFYSPKLKTVTHQEMQQ